jgi:hypothetical protein
VLSGFGFGAEVLMERIEECRSIRQAKAKKPEEKPPAAADEESEDGDGMGTMCVQGDDDEVYLVSVVCVSYVVLRVVCADGVGGRRMTATGVRRWWPPIKMTTKARAKTKTEAAGNSVPPLRPTTSTTAHGAGAGHRDSLSDAAGDTMMVLASGEMSARNDCNGASKAAEADLASASPDELRSLLRAARDRATELTRENQDPKQALMKATMGGK